MSIFQKKTIIFIPAYKAEKTITAVLDRIPKDVLNKVNEILIQDNNSKDQIEKVILKYKKDKNLSKLNIIKNEKNLGYGGTKKKAFNYAIKKGYDIFVMVHADGQYPPEKINDMIKPIEEGKADMVIGSRTNALKGGMQLWKLMGNKILTLAENIVLKMSLEEFHSGYKAYNLHALKTIPYHLCSDGHAISSETIIQFKLKELKIKEILIPTYYGNEISECSTKTSWIYALNVFEMLIQYILVIMGFKVSKKFNIKR
jgi:glycosyltransferase involved in cell wall biosynthesis